MTTRFIFPRWSDACGYLQMVCPERAGFFKPSLPSTFHATQIAQRLPNPESDWSP